MGLLIDFLYGLLIRNLVHAIYVSADVAPTLLDMMGVEASAEMTGKKHADEEVDYAPTGHPNVA